MALCFLHFPAEIRNQIYRYLLVRRKGCIEVKRNWTEDYDHPKEALLEETVRKSKKEALFRVADDPFLSGFFPRILATCRQIYSEAADILYGENVFLYKLPCNRSPFPARQRVVFELAIKRIRWLRVEVLELHCKRNGDFSTPQEFINGLQGLAKLNCSPRGLLFDLYHDTWGKIEAEESPFLLYLTEHNAEFASAVAALNVSHRIDILLADNARNPERNIAVLLQSIEIKGWRSCPDERIRETWPRSYVYRAETLRPTLQGHLPIVRVPSLYSDRSVAESLV